MSQRLIYFLILFSISLNPDSLVFGKDRPQLSYLSKGQTIKVEGKEFQGQKLVADKIRWADDEDDLEIEGPVNNLDLKAGIFSVAVSWVRVNDRTKFENSLRESISFGDLANGIRVKVKVRRVREGVIEAKTVRLYEDSEDRDFEVVAPIESIDLDRSELSLLSMKIKVTPETSYPKIKGLHGTPIRIGPLYLGAKVSFAQGAKRNMQLVDDYRFRPAAQLEVSAPLGQYSEIYTKISTSDKFSFEEGAAERDRVKSRVKEAYLYLGHILHPSVAVQIGRQRFRDEREWVYDERLDALRLHVEHSDLKVELAAAKILSRTTGVPSDKLFLMGRTEYRFPGRRYLAGYVIKRNDTSIVDEDPVWLGLSSGGRVTKNLRYWTELSRMMGRRGPNLLRGYGYDVGTSYRFPISLQPTISLGYAFGSADEDFSDGVDGNFRQTRINDNAYENGVKRYRYYGVLLEPDLFNLKILNLDIGMRPSPNWSLNFAYHHYRQVVPSDEVGDIALERLPAGNSPDFGKEYDLILAFRKQRSFTFNVVLGLFDPGAAFEGDNSRAFLFRQAFTYFF